MKKYDSYLFDLDGTLVDSKIGILNSLKYALNSVGINETDENKLISFIGPPLHLSMKTHYGLDENDTQVVIKKYRERYAEKGMYELKLFPKVEKTLEALKSMGKKICLATSKPKVYALEITKNLGIDKFFDYQEGADLSGKFCEKKYIIASCIEKLKLEKATTLMVGDRLYDAEGAKYVGIDCVGVLCGYGSVKELADAGVKFILNDISELINL